MKKGDELKATIDKGLAGEETGYKTDFHGVSIRKGETTTILGGTGSGKSLVAIGPFGLTPLLDYFDNYRHEPKRVFKWFLYSMEMSRSEVLLRMAAYVYARRTKKLLSPSIIGSWEEDKPLTQADYDWIINECVPLLNELDEYFEIYGKRSVSQMRREIEKFYSQYGKVGTDALGNEVYVTDSNITLLVTVDHVALLKSDSGKKAKIDDYAEMTMELKQVYTTSFLSTQQLNRQEGGLDKLKAMKNPEPQLSEGKDSGDVIDASVNVYALFTPHKFALDVYYGYNIVGDDGLKHRGKFLFKLKGRFSVEYAAALVFYGEAGLFIPLPKAAEMTPLIYRNIKNATYWGHKNGGKTSIK